jgi:hypothetical protein
MNVDKVLTMLEAGYCLIFNRYESETDDGDRECLELYEAYFERGFEKRPVSDDEVIELWNVVLRLPVVNIGAACNSIYVLGSQND